MPRQPAAPATRPPASPSPPAVPRRGLGGGLHAPASRASATRHASASRGGVAPAGGGVQAPSLRAGHQQTGPQASRPEDKNPLRLLQAVFPVGAWPRPGNRALPAIVNRRGAMQWT